MFLSRKIKIGLLGILLTLQFLSVEASKIIYVNCLNSSKVQSGKTWQESFQSLQNALNNANSGDQIWVAKGKYYPSADDPSASIQLKEKVSLYGGFSGSESTLGQRDYKNNTTILSGDIGKGNKTKNSITILKGADDAVLDGFTISDAYSKAENTKLHILPETILKNEVKQGGGMSNFMVGPIVRNCIFKNNYSAKGAAVYNVQKPSGIQARFTNVVFETNKAQARGGAVSNDLGAMPQFINCKFILNESEDKGGALYNDFASSPFLMNCLFLKNSAVTAGAIGNDGGSSPLLVNVTIKDNTAESGMGGGLYQGSGTQNNPIVINSLIDDIYNWHEDIVASSNSSIPDNSSIPLKEFISKSNLKGYISDEDLETFSDSKIGYRKDLDDNYLYNSTLLKKLLAFYKENNGAINYLNEYSRPTLDHQKYEGKIIFVVPDSESKIKDGTSWATALTDIQEAINLSYLNSADIWLKAGDYSPKKISSEIAAYILYDNTKIYGGFAGTEAKLEERNISKNSSAVSAKVKDSSFRYYHVFYGADNVLLDGITIRDGKASGNGYNSKGGGILAYRAGKSYVPIGNQAGTGFIMTINNCTFSDNEALEGGAIYVFAKGNLSVNDTVFSGNIASYAGAVMSRVGNTVTFNNCKFLSNTAELDGGATYDDYGSHSTYLNSLFKNNLGKCHGGAIYVISRASQLEGTQVNIENCTFEGNHSKEGVNIYNLDSSTITIKDSKIKQDSIYGSFSFSDKSSGENVK